MRAGRAIRDDDSKGQGSLGDKRDWKGNNRYSGGEGTVESTTGSVWDGPCRQEQLFYVQGSLHGSVSGKISGFDSFKPTLWHRLDIFNLYLHSLFIGTSKTSLLSNDELAQTVHTYG